MAAASPRVGRPERALRPYRLIRVVAVSCVLVIGWPTGCEAAPQAAPRSPSVSDQAVSLFRESTRAYEEGRFEDAARLLQKAYAIQPEPVMLFNLAKSYEGLGQWQNAIDAYHSYLSHEPSASDRGSIEQRIATLQKQIDDRATLERQRDEERRRADEAAAAANAAVAVQKQREAEEQRSSHRNPLPWVFAGIGLAGVGVGVGLGVASRTRATDAVNDTFKAPAEADYDAARTFATAANVAFAAGGALAVGGLAYGLVTLLSGAKRKASGGVFCSPALCGVTGSF